jgi:hypothetical protein
MISTVDSEALAVSDAPVGLTSSKFTKGVTSVAIYAEGSVRYWTSGKNPTATDGKPLGDGQEITLPLGQAMYFKAIRNGQDNAMLHVEYLRGSS